MSSDIVAVACLLARRSLNGRRRPDIRHRHSSLCSAAARAASGRSATRLANRRLHLGIPSQPVVGLWRRGGTGHKERSGPTGRRAAGHERGVRGRRPSWAANSQTLDPILAMTGSSVSGTERHPASIESSSSAGLLASMHMPVLYPGDPGEALDLGRHTPSTSRVRPDSGRR